MAADKNAVEADWLRSEIIPKLQETQQLSDIDANNAKVVDIKVTFIGAEEAFMLTNCYRAMITFDNGHKRYLVVKKTPSLPLELYQSVGFSTLFHNEIVTYTKILPALEKFMGQPFEAPKYFYGKLDEGSATVVLQDFSENGWRMSAAKANLSLEHVLLAVKYLGRFHGIGFGFRHQDPREFSKVTNKLKEARYEIDSVNPEWDLILKTGIKRLMKATQQHQSTVPKEFVERFERLVSDMFRFGKQRVAPREPMKTICHGDYLRNNVAYKYDEANTPTGVIMFDLQTMRVSSPMVDLCVFLSLSAFTEVRHTHFEQIFNAYCDSLASSYTTFSKRTLPDYLSHESLLQEYTRYLPYGLSIASSFLLELVAPLDCNYDLKEMQDRSEEEIIDSTMNRGGETVDRELAHQMAELYELSVKHKVDVFEGFDYM